MLIYVNICLGRADNISDEKMLFIRPTSPPTQTTTNTNTTTDEDDDVVESGGAVHKLPIIKYKDDNLDENNKTGKFFEVFYFCLI